MKLAIMQPYFFPYLGYYQLVGAVDSFVFFDDVNFINKGWINRNQLLQQNQPLRFTIPLVKASQNKVINEIELEDFDKWRNGFLKTVEMSYKKAPHFSFMFNWLKEFLFKDDYSLIGDLAAESVKAIARLLDLTTQFKSAASLHYKNGKMQDGPQKVMEICRILGTDTYINAKNGTALYDSQQFAAMNIELKFIDMHEIRYMQFKRDQFVRGLSIIDVLMFNSLAETKQLLTEFSLK
ncbi:MAG: WbqC family protein [Ferruginibacter sp.]